MGRSSRPTCLPKSGLAQASTLSDRLKTLPVLVQALRDQPSLSAAYMGYDKGDFFLIRRLVPGSWLARSLKPPADAAYLVQSVEGGKLGMAESHFLFFDEARALLEDRPMPDYAYDPRSRPWFGQALHRAGVAITAPYLFFTTHEVGTTFARRSPDGHAVAGVDVTLAAMSGLLHDLRPTPSAELVLINDRGEVLADANTAQYPLANNSAAAQLPQIDKLGRPVLASIGGTKPQAAFRLFPVETARGTWQALVSLLPEPGAPFYLAMAAPQSELLAQVYRIRNQSLLVAVAVMLISLAFTLALSRLASRPLAALTREAAAIRALKFDQPLAVRSFITEIDALARTMGAMKSTIQRFLGIGAVLAGERRFDRLLDRILMEMIRVAAARGGIVYLAEPGGHFKCALARWDGRVVGQGPPDLNMTRDLYHPVIRATTGGALTYLMTSADLARWYPGFEHREPLATLAVPLRNRQDEVVGVLMLFQDPEALKGAEEHDILALVEAVSGTAAVAIETQRLILEQKRLLESFIELVAGAIDRKSPYTGGHCQRVPELTKMIARAAETATDGPFNDFALSEVQWEELHIAAWLHDCGKVTTPEYVVDKATKLETIYDRLHEVRMRFEVLKREAEVACWKAIAEGGAARTAAAELRALLGGAGRGVRLRRRLQRGRRVHGGRQDCSPAPDSRAQVDTHARRPPGPVPGREAAQGPRAGRSAARRSSRCWPTGPSMSSSGGTRIAWPPTTPGASRSRCPRSSTTAARSTTSASARGTLTDRGPLQDQRAYGRDHPHALAPAAAAASEPGGRDRRRTSREDGRHGLSAAPQARAR